MDKPRYLACVQHENQNGVACGCPASTGILRQPTFCKVTKVQFLKFYAKTFYLIFVFNNRREDKILSGYEAISLILCLCQRFLRLREVFSF